MEFDNARDGALSGFFSYGSVNKIGGSGASNFPALGVGWEEQLFHFYFLSSGARFLLYVLITIGYLL